MPISVAVPKETVPGERRAALVPGVAEQLAKQGLQVLIQSDAGLGAFYRNSEYASARIVFDAGTLFAEADIVLTVQPLTPEAIARLREGTIVIGFLHPYQDPERAAQSARPQAHELRGRADPAHLARPVHGRAVVAGGVAGYKAALIAANKLDKFLPMLTTAAGTIRPAQVLVIGAGVAGLQAIATARRLGAIVEAYDVRSATRNRSSRWAPSSSRPASAAEGAGGYARELTAEEKAKQQEVLDQHIAEADAVITTAAIPGRPAPRIISKAAVARMKPGRGDRGPRRRERRQLRAHGAGETVSHRTA